MTNWISRKRSFQCNRNPSPEPAGNENNVPAGFFTVQTLKTTVRRKSVETIVSRSYDEPGITAAFIPENQVVLSKQKGWEILYWLSCTLLSG